MTYEGEREVTGVRVGGQRKEDGASTVAPRLIGGDKAVGFALLLAMLSRSKTRACLSLTTILFGWVLAEVVYGN